MLWFVRGRKMRSSEVLEAPGLPPGPPAAVAAARARLAARLAETCPALADYLAPAPVAAANGSDSDSEPAGRVIQCSLHLNTFTRLPPFVDRLSFIEERVDATGAKGPRRGTRGLRDAPRSRLRLGSPEAPS